MPNNKLNYRILVKIIATGINFLLSITLGLLVPKIIGPESYGNYSYVISTYAFLFQILMFSSGTAYIYFLSTDKYDAREVNTFYLLFLFSIASIVIVVTVIFTNNDYGIIYLWNGLNNKGLIYLGLLFGILANFQQRFVEYSDSTSQTVQSEKIKLLSKFMMVVSILVFIFFEKLNIYWFFIISILNFIVFTLLFIKYINYYVVFISFEKYKNIFNDFYKYLRPLISFTLIAGLFSYLGKYVLQFSSGSIEQGYYNFAFQLAMIPVTFISSFMAIYLSEMSRKFKENDLESVKNIFTSNVFKIYAVHAIISLFMLVNAQEIIFLSVGKFFLPATNSLKWLSIFSLLHSFGLLSSNIFFSSGRNKQYSLINSIVMISGILYLTSLRFYGEINSTHLATVMASLYMFRVFVQLNFNLKYLSISRLKFFLEFLVLSSIIYVVLKIMSLVVFNLFINFILTLVCLAIVNFIFKDYFKLSLIIKKI